MTDEVPATWALSGDQGLLTKPAPFTSNPLSLQSRACKSNKSTAFSSWRYFQFAGREEVVSLERMCKDREQFSEKEELSGKRARDS